MMMNQIQTKFMILLRLDACYHIAQVLWYWGIAHMTESSLEMSDNSIIKNINDIKRDHKTVKYA